MVNVLVFTFLFKPTFQPVSIVNGLITVCSLTLTLPPTTTPRSGIHDERVGLLHNVFCSISQRFSMPLKSGVNCSQGLSENDVLWSLNHSFTINSVIVVLEYAREEKRKSNPLMEKSVHSVQLATLNIDLNHSVIELI